MYKKRYNKCYNEIHYFVFLLKINKNAVKMQIPAFVFLTTLLLVPCGAIVTKVFRNTDKMEHLMVSVGWPFQGHNRHLIAVLKGFKIRSLQSSKGLFKYDGAIILNPHILMGEVYSSLYESTGSLQNGNDCLGKKALTEI